MSAARERLGRLRAGGSAALGRLRPRTTAEWLLLCLVLAGAWLRVVAAASWWPVTTTLADSWPYAFYAGTNPLDNPQHPGGYSALLAVIGAVTREVAVPVVLQHLAGIATALVLFAAVWRLTGSQWPALVPAAAVLLNADQIYLERSIMSEAPFALLLALALYLAVRALDEPDPWWRWPLALGVIAAAATMVRSAGLFFIPVAIAALLLAAPRPWLRRWRATAAVAGSALALLVAYAFGSLASNGRFEVGPSQGWHLYQRVAPFADCSQFEPPEGTEALCEETPVAERPGGDFYLFHPQSPAVQEFEFIGNEDDKIGAWAREALLAHPGAFVDAVTHDLLAFFVPSAHPETPYSGGGLDPQLDWRAAVPPLDPVTEKTERDTEAGMEEFFADFTVTKDAGGLELLHDYQRVFRFGATPLTLSVMVAALGLAVGPRRTRVGVLLFGLGGLALLIAPVIGGIYVGRYAVPLAGPLTAAAAIAATAIWRMEAARRRRERDASLGG